MGSISTITQLLRSTALSDDSILRVIQPSPADIAQRTELIRQSDGMVPKAIMLPEDVMLPKLADWRLENPIGADLANVAVNHFLVDTKCVPKILYNYSVTIYKYKNTTGTGTGDFVRSKDRSDAEINKDFCLDGDESECYAVMKTMIQSHTQYQQQDGMQVGEYSHRRHFKTLHKITYHSV